MTEPALHIRLKRAYEPAEPSDGYRVLIDRLWPRGLSRERALDEWNRELAPSTELRKWFGHEPGRFEEFRQRYVDELRAHRSALAGLRRRARKGKVTLVYAAKDIEHNGAIVLAEVLRRGLIEEDRPMIGELPCFPPSGQLQSATISSGAAPWSASTSSRRRS